MGLKHLLGDAVGLQNALDQALEGQHGLRLQQIGLALLGGQAVHNLLNEWTDHLLLLIAVQAQFRGDIDQKQGFLGVMIHNGRRQGPLITTMRALCHIGRTAQQQRFGARVLRHIKNLAHLGQDRLTALWTLNLGFGHFALS